MRSTKKLLLAVIAAAAIVLGACTEKEVSKKPARVITEMQAGVYTETVTGISEGLVVDVTLSKDKIEAITVK